MTQKRIPTDISEYVNVVARIPYKEQFMIAFETTLTIIFTFYCGFQFGKTKNAIWMLAFLIILVGKSIWQNYNYKMKRVKLR